MDKWNKIRSHLQTTRQRIIRKFQLIPDILYFVLKPIQGPDDEFQNILEEDRDRRSLAPSVESVIY